MGDPRYEQQVYDRDIGWCILLFSSPKLVSALKIWYPPGSKLYPTTFSLKASLYPGATDISPLLRMMPSVGDEPQRRKVTQHRFFLAASQTKHWADFFLCHCSLLCVEPLGESASRLRGLRWSTRRNPLPSARNYRGGRRGPSQSAAGGEAGAGSPSSGPGGLCWRATASLRCAHRIASLF